MFRAATLVGSGFEVGNRCLMRHCRASRQRHTALVRVQSSLFSRQGGFVWWEMFRATAQVGSGFEVGNRWLMQHSRASRAVAHGMTS
ncbi:hypothetical protein [Gimesia panareensis]|uniref:hypothetical protein n=1 Tax=Gimesia panareensis TaxID=2527978 RepID=UPI0011A53E6E|nr:hypothetical protein [Gimesia panareensis]